MDSHNLFEVEGQSTSEYYHGLNSPILGKDGVCPVPENDLPFSYCSLDASGRSCTPLDGYFERESYFNFAHLGQIARGPVNGMDGATFGIVGADAYQSYPVKFNEGICSVENAVTECINKASGICQAVFNTTNPNVRQSYPLTPMWLGICFTFVFMICIALSLGIYMLNANLHHTGTNLSINARLRFKFDSIVAMMMRQEYERRAMLMNMYNLCFYDEEYEYAFVKHKILIGINWSLLFFSSTLVLVFGLALQSPGLPFYDLRYILVVIDMAAVPFCFKPIFLRFPGIAVRFLPLMVALVLVVILLTFLYDGVLGVRVGYLPLCVIIFVLNQLIVLQGFVFFHKVFLVALLNVLYSVFILKGFKRDCYLHSSENSYPSLSMFLSREQFRDSCDPDGDAAMDSWCIFAAFCSAALSIYTTYASESIERLSFVAKYEVTLQKMETDNRIKKMESALKAKELNPEQLNLVTSLMKDGQESREGDALTSTEPNRMRKRRASISSANAIQQLRIKQDDVEIVENNIGRGAFGDVHKAKYNGIFVAIKTVTTIEKETLLNFRNEVLIMNQLRHPNIIMLLGAVWSKEMVGVVLEFAERGSLSEILKKEKNVGGVEEWSWRNRKLQIATDVAEGMRFVHGTGYYDEFSGEHKENLLHRDLKTGNILLTENWRSKVADFGSTKVIGAGADDESMTMTGTPMYMAPEIVRGEKYDKSCDVYSFAVVLYAMAVEKGNVQEGFLAVANSLHHTNTASMALMNLVAEHAVRPNLSKLDAPESLKMLIGRCWADRPKSRPTFPQVIDILANVADEVEDENVKLMKEQTSRKLRLADEKAKRRNLSKARISKAQLSVRQLSAPLILMKATDFLRRTRLLPYENVRDLDPLSLVTLDTMEKAEKFFKGNYTIFFSHEWLSYRNPDPLSAQCEVMKEATRQLVAQKDVDVEATFVWCDYFSIAQENREFQRLAIMSLPAVASSLHSFVMVAPKANHADRKEDCSLATYKDRGWCRAELLSHVARRGRKQVYVAVGCGSHDILPLEKVGEKGNEASGEICDILGLRGENILSDMCSVFTGKFTCCQTGHINSSQCDREKLVEPMLGLYCGIYRSRLNTNVAPIYKMIEPKKNDMFPSEIEIEIQGDKSEKRNLFGDILKIAEEEIDFENMLLGAQMQDGGAVELESPKEVASEDKDLSSVLVHREDLNFDIGDDEASELSKFDSIKSTYKLCYFRGHLVAADILDLSWDEDEAQDIMAEFKRECLLMKELKHENILMLVGVLWTSDLICIILEFVAGGDVYNFIESASSEVLKWRKSKLKIAKGVVRGMKYLHGCVFYDSSLKTYREGVVHRMLGSESVLVGYEEDEDCRMIVKIANFSHSRVVANDDSAMTVIGYDFSMAPEVYRGDPYDAKCDVFSFATLLVELAVAESAKRGDKVGLEDLLRKSIEGRLEGSTGSRGAPVTLRSKKAINRAKVVKMFMKGAAKPKLDETTAPQCPGAILDLIERCYSYRPEDRPSFSEIDAFLKGKEIEEQIVGMDADGKNEERLKELKDELRKGSELREQELENERKRAQKRLKERMEKVREKKAKTEKA